MGGSIPSAICTMARWQSLCRSPIGERSLATDPRRDRTYATAILMPI